VIRKTARDKLYCFGIDMIGSELKSFLGFMLLPSGKLRPEEIEVIAGLQNDDYAAVYSICSLIINCRLRHTGD
jgi:hypothetical protein